MTELEAGWFADPRGAEGTWRWWDGRTWTGWLSRDASAAAPAVADSEPDPSADDPEPDPSADDPEPDPSPDDAEPDPSPDDEGPDSDPAPDPAPDVAPDVGPTRVPFPLAAVVIIGAVILGLITVGAVVWLSEPRLATGPTALPPDAAQLSGLVAYDGATRQASVYEMRVTLPAAPYECESVSGPKPPALTSARTCNALVHENYNAAGDDWYASFGLAVVSEDLVGPGGVRTTAGQVFDGLVDQIYAGQQTTVKNREPATVDMTQPGQGAAYIGQVHYDEPGLSSRYDRAVVIVAELAGGDYAVCFSFRPDDTPQPTLDVLNAAINSLTAK